MPHQGYRLHQCVRCRNVYVLGLRIHVWGHHSLSSVHLRERNDHNKPVSMVLPSLLLCLQIAIFWKTWRRYIAFLAVEGIAKPYVMLFLLYLLSICSLKLCNQGVYSLVSLQIGTERDQEWSPQEIWADNFRAVSSKIKLRKPFHQLTKNKNVIETLIKIYPHHQPVLGSTTADIENETVSLAGIGRAFTRPSLIAWSILQLSIVSTFT